jgi:hypothetical protein
MANILRQNVGSVFSVTHGSTIANNAYSASGDKLTIDNGTNKALLADFEFEATFAVAPVAGSVVLVAVDYSLDGATAGPTPSATMRPRVVGTFTPTAIASNAATSWRMRINSVPLTAKSDYYVLNNGTTQTISASAVLRAQCWTPGTP